MVAGAATPARGRERGSLLNPKEVSVEAPPNLNTAQAEAAQSLSGQLMVLAGPGTAEMHAKCTTTLPSGFADDWGALVQQAKDSDVLCNQFDALGHCTEN